MKLVLDTDILSAVMRGDLNALRNAGHYLGQYRRFTFSIITRYEILRGLKAKDAVRQIQRFDQLCDESEILPLSDEVVVRAAELYADLRQRGVLVGDADILIAASALTCDMGVATNNQVHFQRFHGLRLMNWLTQ